MKITIVDIDPIIIKEDVEADEKIKKSWHWGNTGQLQKRTVWFCKIFIARNMDKQGILDITSLMAELKKYELEVKNDNNDEYGYAYGTVHEIFERINGIIVLADDSNDKNTGLIDKLQYPLKLALLKKKYRKYL